MLLDARRRPFAVAIAAVIAATLALLGISIPTAAHADVSSNGVTLSVNYGSDQYDGTTVVTPGTDYTATVQYNLDKVEPGQIVTVAVPDGVTVTDPDLSGADAIQSASIADGQLTVKFKDPLSGNQQGYFDLHFKVADPGDHSVSKDLTWSLDSTQDTKTVIIKNPGTYDPKPADFSTSLGKGVTTPGFDGAVSYDPATEAVTVDNSGKDITAPGALKYTLTVDVADAETFDLSDVLDDRLAYDESSFDATLTTWTAQGDKNVDDFALGTPTFADNGFAINGVTVDEPAILTVTYTAHVKDSAVADIIDTLEHGDGTDGSQGVDDINSETGGDIWVDFANTASSTITDDATAKGRLGTHVDAEPQPNVGPAFGKDLESEATTVLNPGGNTDGDGDPDMSTTLPLTTEYTLTANLGAFDDTDDAWLPKWDLTDDVVLHDQLPAGMVWDAATVASNAGLTLLDASAVPATLNEDTFVAATSEGDYWIDTSTRTLWVNLGQDTAKDWSIDVATVLQDADALSHIPTWNDTDPQVATAYYLANQANYYYWDGRGSGDHDKHQVNKDAKHRDLLVVKDAGSTIDDANAFDKTIGDLPQMTSGEAYDVPFTFTFGDGAIVDFSQSQILDHVNHDVFDVTDETLPAIKDSITGSYAGQSGLSGDDFTLSLDSGTGDLVITPSSTFGSDLASTPATPLNKALTVHFTLPTHVIQGKQTLDVSNSATVTGGTKNDYDWTSTASGSATSYGNELEVEKSVYDGDNSTWTKNLRVQLDADGMPVQSEFIYRVKLRPHGTFAGHAILDITDALPDGTTLLGFVTDDQLDSGDIETGKTTVDLDGNLTATMDADADTVVISQKDGTTLTPGATPSVNFKVRIDSFTDAAAFIADLGVTNRIGPNQATITPSNGYPLQILKTDALRPDVVITDRDARFTITAPDGTVITNAAYVVNGQLMVEKDGEDHGIVIPAGPGNTVPAGDYTVTETKAPAGYKLPADEADRTVVATIHPDGSSNSVTIADQPKPLYAIGDYTWIDANRNGVQDSGEKVLPDVKVELLDADSGDVVRTTSTDEKGHYLFDLLPAGDYKVRFTLTDDQAKTYTFTGATQGGDVTKDSDADPASGESGVIHLNSDDDDQLVPGSSYQDGDVQALNGIDPTWDAGVVEKSYAIGDYTWIDANRNGVQDDGEKVLPDVKVELTDADGNAVQDVNGDDVAATTTDSNGHYLFDDLPAGDYKVHFTLTDDQSKQYVFTTTGDGSATDSDATVSDDQAVGVTKSISLGDGDTALTTDYDTADVQATEGIDPTWDAGVVSKSVRVGDRVWIDKNKNGRQDKGDPGLPGVVLVLTGPDGGPVTDVFGNPVKPVTTDEDGKYLFPDLPVLSDGEHYSVGIDKDASAGALEGYLPTSAGQGDRAGDSSTWTASSEGLTSDGEQDLTLDFGFVDPVAQLAPTQDGPGATAPAGGLATTGTALATGAIGVALLLLLMGVALLLVRRRRQRAAGVPHER